MTIRLYDTAAREKRVFTPQDPTRVTMYVCGPTVYNYAHIGNARPPIVFDVLRRLLIRTYGEHAVVYARNITDIEDKIIKASLESGEPISVITKKFADIYNADTTALNVLAPTIEPWATAHVGEMIEMIGKLMRKGYAYAGKEGVWFSVKQMPDYGKLSGRKLTNAIRPISPSGSSPSRASRKTRSGIAPGAGDGPAGISNARPWRPSISARRSTFMAAALTCNSPIMRTRSPSQSAPTGK